MIKDAKHRLWFAWLITAGLLTIGVVLFVYQLPKVNATTDEYEHLNNGEHVVRHLRWDTVEVIRHPPLSFYLQGWVSVVFSRTEGDARLLLARLSRLPLYLLAGGAIFYTTRRLYGFTAGIFSLILYVFNPEILAHSRLLTLDFTLATFFLLSIISFHAFARRPTFVRTILAGICLGFALLSKTPALILVLIYLPFSLYVSFRNRSVIQVLPRLFVIYLLAFIILHGGYVFSETGKLPNQWQSERFQALMTKPALRPLFFLFPRAYLVGWDELTRISETGWQGFLAGTYYENGRWYYFPTVFLLKTPLPLLILLCLWVALLISHRLSSSSDINLLIGSVIILYVVYFSFFNKVNIGFRYLLWMFPLFFLLLSPLANILWGRANKFYRTFLVFLLLWYIGGVIRIAPFYLAFTNELTGGPKNAWKYLADSSLDWNQDAKFFADYQMSHPELIVNPKLPTPGKIAVTVNMLNLDSHFETHWLRRLHKEPVTEVGYTWLIFDVTQDDVNSL